MIVFAVISLLPSHPELEKAIIEKFPGNFLKLSDSNWLVASSGTAQELSRALNVDTGGLGSTVIFSTAGYYGRAPTNIWEWITAKLEAPAHG